VTPVDPSATADAAPASVAKDTPAGKDKPARRPPPTGWQLTALLGTLIAESLALLALGFANLPYARGVGGLTGTAIWVLFGLVAASAALAFARRRRDPGSWWVPTTYLAQLSTIAVAVYVATVEVQSQVIQWCVVAGATIVAALATGWMFALRHHVSGIELTWLQKTGATLITLASVIVGLGQAWYQNDYLPKASLPKVDMSAELTEMSRTGNIAHIATTITMKNQGTLAVQSLGSVMRVAGYPPDAVVAEPSDANHLAGALDFGFLPPSREFRSNATDWTKHKLLYSDDFMNFHSVLTPGMEVSYQRVVDVDITQTPRVRLSVQVGLFNSRYLGTSETCSTRTAVREGDPLFEPTAMTPGTEDQLTALCVDTFLKPRNIVDRLVGDHPSVRLVYVLAPPGCGGTAPPCPPAETPFYYFKWHTDGSNGWQQHLRPNKLEDAYPNIELLRSSEIAFGDKPPTK
jgi:hypothetical protein